jgi:hypothetical protein
MSKIKGTYDADARAKKRTESKIVIGGREFFPRKKSMQMMGEWNEVAPKAEVAEDPDRDPMENFRDVYKQVQVFVQDSEGGRPDLEFLEAELDVEDAVDLLMILQPSMGQEAERARDLEGEAAATPT